jgi:hypothetical protein
MVCPVRNHLLAHWNKIYYIAPFKTKILKIYIVLQAKENFFCSLISFKTC